MNGTEGFAAVSFDFSDIVQLDDIPALFAVLLLAAVGAAVCLNVIRSIVRAVRKNRGNWKPFPDSGLMYSYAAGSGFYHLKKVYLDAHRFAFDRKWTAVSFAGAAYRLGNYAHESQLLMFRCFCSAVWKWRGGMRLLPCCMRCCLCCMRRCWRCCIW